MITAGGIDEVRRLIGEAKKAGKTIGFVPTMGALHEGHLSLVRRAKSECDYVAVSVFVNPTQFGEGEDLDKYPRDIEKDSAMLSAEGTDLLFFPTTDDMYPDGFDTWVVPGGPASILEGERRPGHFKGVCTVVLKLFQIVSPDKAFFGQKDAQQFTVLNRMVIDLNLALQMIECPIVREADGLAMSSRNAYLNSKERKAAVIFNQAITRGAEIIKDGNSTRDQVITEISKVLSKEPLARLDYAEIVNAEDFSVIEKPRGVVYILIAGFIGGTRLIDNIKLKIEK
ncbi:MAG: pantoate--beta-alanine ligase [Acidobacteria bacterium]|nr:pantoate--beta-alanine ligase [Acidobacteriota bacterium]